MNITTVTHPDQTVSKRTSKNGHYTHAIEASVPRAFYITEAQGRLDYGVARLALLEAALADGTVVREIKPWISGGEYVEVAVGGEHATSYTTGTQYSTAPVSDDEARAVLVGWIADLAGKDLPLLVARMARAETKPAFTYGVVRWSSRQELALKAIKEFSYLTDRGQSLRVVAVDAV